MTLINIDLGYYKGETRVEEGSYEANNERAFMLVDPETDELLTTITVCLDWYGMSVNNPNEIFVKSYSENEGLAEALLEVGFITEILERITVGYANNGVARATLAEEYRV